ncbi:hypothetical protein [Nocardioides pinisoli]|uniref:Uncharacterized protein n=1 Tax=Nocardioides pinisoli TaxID=2950279 RepID=A0ABT1L2T3_9ACTN|nr:hypothetical protein [Nocardioides pinisoli]MCP3423899.1 hypothetical protein [Nocardioides pinisoli]
MTERSDFAAYVDARWPDLVGGLEDEGVAGDRARLAVAEALLGARRSWERRVREEQVDVTLWAEVRERAGLAARPGEPVPHAVRPRDPRDGPEEWLERAGRTRAARRRRGAQRALVGLAVLAVLAAGWSWWAGRPDPPAVREEANPLPVHWYAEDELHLQDVVVELPGLEAFVADFTDDTAVVARLRSGEVVRVDAEGELQPVDEAPPALDTVPIPPPVRGIGPYDALVESVPLAGGGWAHLVDSARRAGAEDDLRQSETGRRAVVVCPTEWTCEEPVTVVADGTVRLR